MATYQVLGEDQRLGFAGVREDELGGREEAEIRGEGPEFPRVRAPFSSYSVPSYWTCKECILPQTQVSRVKSLPSTRLSLEDNWLPPFLAPAHMLHRSRTLFSINISFSISNEVKQGLRFFPSLQGRCD